MSDDTISQSSRRSIVKTCQQSQILNQWVTCVASCQRKKVADDCQDPSFHANASAVLMPIMPLPIPIPKNIRIKRVQLETPNKLQGCKEDKKSNPQIVVANGCKCTNAKSNLTKKAKKRDKDRENRMQSARQLQNQFLQLNQT